MSNFKKFVRSALWGFTRKKFGVRKGLRLLAETYLDNYYDSAGGLEINGEQRMLETLKQLGLKTVFDVGANVGEWSLIAAQFFPEATIHAFELSQSTFSTTASRLRGGNFKANNVGMSNVVSTIQYKDYGEKARVNTILSNADFWDETIPYVTKESVLTTGDTYCLENGITFVDVLKIDVEGADHLVLQGFNEMLTKKHIRVIQFEYGYTHADAKFLMRDFFSLLNAKGYIVGKLWADGVEFSDFFYWLNNFRSGPNFVAVREDDIEVINLISAKRPSVFTGSNKPIFRQLTRR